MAESLPAALMAETLAAALMAESLPAEPPGMRLSEPHSKWGPVFDCNLMGTQFGDLESPSLTGDWIQPLDMLCFVYFAYFFKLN